MPFLALPAVICLASPHLARPSRAFPDLPRLALPDRTGTRLALPAVMCHT